MKTKVMEAKFRGKRTDNGEWVVGSFIAPNLIVGDVADIDWGSFATEWWVKVIPETIGLFTGLKDKNGIEIYGGDIIRFCDDPPYCHDYIIKYDEERLIWIADGVNDFMEDLWELECEFVRVIGNIYDDSELLKTI